MGKQCGFRDLVFKNLSLSLPLFIILPRVDLQHQKTTQLTATSRFSYGRKLCARAIENLCKIPAHLSKLHFWPLTQRRGTFNFSLPRSVRCVGPVILKSTFKCQTNLFTRGHVFARTWSRLTFVCVTRVPVLPSKPRTRADWHSRRTLSSSQRGLLLRLPFVFFRALVRGKKFCNYFLMTFTECNTTAKWARKDK